MMKTVATIGPSVRLIVFQFLVPEKLVPVGVPPRRRPSGDASLGKDSLPPISGVEVLPSTSNVYLLNLIDGIYGIVDGCGSYELVDSWFEPSLKHFGKCFVRYVLCHKMHVKTDELHPDFVAKRDGLMESLVNLVYENIWTIQGHLNPYFERDGEPSNHKVLMFGCVGRVPAFDQKGNPVTVYRDGRDDHGQGLGPKVPVWTKAHQLILAMNDIVLTDGIERAPITGRPALS
jgi:hypothetical protein